MTTQAVYRTPRQYRSKTTKGDVNRGVVYKDSRHDVINRAIAKHEELQKMLVELLAIAKVKCINYNAVENFLHAVEDAIGYNLHIDGTRIIRDVAIAIENTARQ